LRVYTLNKEKGVQPFFMEKQRESAERNTMSSKRFLITGATGTVGATGRKTAIEK
jgi:FlaA1/EpsC-like NDP-sugar epimerase